MKKVLLLLVLILVLVIGYKYNFTNGNSHTNSKYGFKFSYDDVTKLDQKGNLFTCGSKYDCASFTGSPAFGYLANYQENLSVLSAGHEDVKVKYIGRTEEVQQGNTVVGVATYSPERLFYEYNFKDGKVYKNYVDEDVLNTMIQNTNPRIQFNLTREELLANETIQKYLKKESEATPFYSNKNNVDFYVANYGETQTYCAFKELGDKLKAKIVCFYEENSNSSEDTKPTGSILKALETFSFK